MAFRPNAPFRAWAIDLAGPFPRDDKNHVYLAVATDLFSKWVEATPIESKHAFRTASWFHNHICARYGKPSMVRTDNGGEWAAEFG